MAAEVIALKYASDECDDVITPETGLNGCEAGGIPDPEPGCGVGGDGNPASPYSENGIPASAEPMSGPLAAILIFSSSASCSLFDLARRFWNQIFT